MFRLKKIKFLIWINMIAKVRFLLVFFMLFILSLISVKNMTSFNESFYLSSSSSLISTTTKAVPFSHVSLTTGYICVFVSTILWGTFLLPIKHFNTGDGVFFQFVTCIAVWFTGVFVYCIREFPRFYVLASLGGVFIKFKLTK